MLLEVLGDKPIFAPTKCSTSITDLLVAIAPRVAKVTDSMVAMNIKIRILMLAPTAVLAMVRMLGPSSHDDRQGRRPGA